MTKKEKPIDINSLSDDRQKKVRKVRGKLKSRRGYPLCSKVMDDKTVDPLLDDIINS